MADYSIYTDRDLLSQIKEDDERAMTEIFNRYWDRLLAVAMNRLNQQLEDSEECVQDGLSNTEIAGQLGIAEKTVEAHLTKAAKDLEENLKKHLPTVLLVVCAEGLKYWL